MLPGMPTISQKAQQAPRAAPRVAGGGSAESHGQPVVSIAADSTRFVPIGGHKGQERESDRERSHQEASDLDRLTQLIPQAGLGEDRRKRHERDRWEAESRRADVQATQAWQTQDNPW